MDSKEHLIVNLKKENEFLKKENEFLKSEFIKLTGTFPNLDGNVMAFNFALPNLPFINQSFQAVNNTNTNNTVPNDDFEKLKEGNNEMKKLNEKFKRQNTNLVNENMILNAKLSNLENVFVGSSIIRNVDGSVMSEAGQDYNVSTVSV